MVEFPKTVALMTLHPFLNFPNQQLPLNSLMPGIVGPFNGENPLSQQSRAAGVSGSWCVRWFFLGTFHHEKYAF